MKIMDRLTALKWQGMGDRLKDVFYMVAKWPQWVFRKDDAHEF